MDFHVHVEDKDMYLPIDMYTVGIKVKPLSNIANKYKITLLRKVKGDDWGTTTDKLAAGHFIDCSTLAAMDVAQTDEGVDLAVGTYEYCATLVKGVLIFSADPAELLTEYVDALEE